MGAMEDNHREEPVKNLQDGSRDEAEIRRVTDNYEKNGWVLVNDEVISPNRDGDGRDAVILAFKKVRS